MARPAKPWYWKARKTWCVYHKGERVLWGQISLRPYASIIKLCRSQKRNATPSIGGL